ncbi:uncharacterized protein K460DRAFT_405425 [Cucurbitaria berberidis CBS 394.84]|uniref:Rhodopsin domain-containing protein n=1 Tax=Cucurbitaria berberidis CBS 394.84 TaxID=1168544 RepID=A0A9P4GH55_9PLEO|nr:uncharacterized protein K460DRAFT_405425 [Cucurbitaria berberidis CBS 394.84]KAF1845154.1 hypothetical protein K460DRAFT_405425 [Cucurbitaria berberidis CBS 394.84]
MAGVDIPKWMWALADDYPFAPPPPRVIPNFDHPKRVGYHSLTIALDNKRSYGYHAWDIKIRNLTKPLLVVTFVYQMFLPATVWLVKATLMFFILSAFKPIKWLRSLCWVGIITTFTFYATNFVIQVVSCRPRGGTDRVSFLAGMASRQCAGSDAAIQKMSIATGIFGVISDFYILIIPLPAVAKLQIRKKRKLGVYLIFSSGALACMASIISLIFRVRSFGSKDLLVDSMPSMASHMVELTVGLVITCIAPTAKLGRHIRNKRFQSLLGECTDEVVGPERAVRLATRRKHAPGGLSELDSMKTFGTTVDMTVTKDPCSVKDSTANASPDGTCIS